MPLIIAYRNNIAVRLSDVAEVVDQVQDLRNDGISNGKAAVLVILYRQPGANIIETADRVRDLLPQLKASIPSAKEEKTMFLPERAVNYRYGVYKVFLLNGNRVSERQIRPAGQTEDERGRRIEVAEGLKPGDRVAVAISGDLRDGATVQEQTEVATPAAK